MDESTLPMTSKLIVKYVKTSPRPNLKADISPKTYHIRAQGVSKTPKAKKEDELQHKPRRVNVQKNMIFRGELRKEDPIEQKEWKRKIEKRLSRTP